MRAIVFDQPGGPEVLKIAEVDDPVPGHGEVLIRVQSAGLNNADLLQRRGLYPPPPGVSPLMGLEVAGVVEALGAGVTQHKSGDRVMALLAGGGYAEKVSVAAELAMPIPANISMEQAGGIPEAFLTAFLELVTLGELKNGEALLIHAGASGVGTAAIQIAREIGANVMVTAGSENKLKKCRELGASHAINYMTSDFAVEIKNTTSGKGVDCILDLVGAPYWQKNIESLSVGGRLLLVGLSGGAKAEANLCDILNKRIKIIVSTTFPIFALVSKYR